MRLRQDIEQGSVLYIWWKSRTRQRYKIGVAMCTSVVRKTFAEVTEEEARLDGFADKDSLAQCLKKLHKSRMFDLETAVFSIISWRWTNQRLYGEDLQTTLFVEKEAVVL